MLIPLEKLKWIYDKILHLVLLNRDQNNLNKGTSIAIFVSNDIDSLASLRILTSLLKQDQTPFYAVPVFSNSHLIKEIQNLNKLNNQASSINGLIFINCGGQIDQTQCWYYYNKEQKSSEVKIFIFDHHRPFHHNNLIDPMKKIVIPMDGCNSFKKYPSAEDIQILQECGEIFEDDEDDDEDIDSDVEEMKDELIELKDDQKNFMPSQRLSQRLSQKATQKVIQQPTQKTQVLGKRQIDAIIGATQQSQRSIKQSAAELIQSQTSLKRRKLSQEETMDIRQLRRQKRAIIQRYYGGYFYWKCTSMVMYQMCQALNRDSLDSLWLYIIGITDSITQGRQSQYQFDQEIIDINNELVRLDVSDLNQLNNNSSFQRNNPEEEENKFSSDGIIIHKEKELQLNSESQKDLFKLVYQKTGNKKAGTIFSEQDLRLVLVRHWTLYDSLMYSNYTASVIQPQTEPGQKQVKRLLASIGISMDQAKQQFVFMDPISKNEYKRKIIDHAHSFNLDNIAISSFTRQFDWKTQISAFDMTYAVSSILQCPQNLGDKQSIEDLQVSDSTHSSKQTLDFDLVKQLIKRSIKKQNIQSAANTAEQEVFNKTMNETKYSNFWVAYDLLKTQNRSLLTLGIKLAKEMQMAIIQLGTILIDTKEVKYTSYFRYVFINSDTLAHARYFQYPLALQRLAIFIMESYRQRKPSSKEKPLIISVRNSLKGMTLICSQIGNGYTGFVERNEMGIVFRQVAQNSGVVSAMVHEGFDHSFIEIRNQDFRPFFENLISFYQSLRE